jgi:hypothetical protein
MDPTVEILTALTLSNAVRPGPLDSGRRIILTLQFAYNPAPGCRESSLPTRKSEKLFQKMSKFKKGYAHVNLLA